MSLQTIRVARLVSSEPRWFQEGCHAGKALRIKHLGSSSVCDVRHLPLPLAAYTASQRRALGSKDILRADRMDCPVGQTNHLYSVYRNRTLKRLRQRARLLQCAEPVSKLVMLQCKSLGAPS